MANKYSPADITARLLVDAGVGVTGGTVGDWPIFTADEASDPDNVITVYDRDAPNQGRTMPDSEVQGQSGLQIRVRATDHLTGWAKCDEIFSLLSSVYDTRVQIQLHPSGSKNFNVHNYCGISNIIPIGKDVSNTRRRLFTINCTVSMRLL